MIEILVAYSVNTAVTAFRTDKLNSERWRFRSESERDNLVGFSHQVTWPNARF